MLKIVLVVCLLLAFVAPLRRFLFWLVVGRQMVKEQKRYDQETNRKQKSEGNIHVDYVPKESEQTRFKGGQYVDFEEVE